MSTHLCKIILDNTIYIWYNVFIQAKGKVYIHMSTFEDMNNPDSRAVKCINCDKVIAFNTGYRFIVCDCESKYIAVDGGPPDDKGSYVRIIGSFKQMIFLDEDLNRVMSDDGDHTH